MTAKSFAMKASSKIAELTINEMKNVSGGDVKDKRRDKNPDNDTLRQTDASGDNFEWKDDHGPNRPLVASFGF